jgi:hypothetical protein
VVSGVVRAGLGSDVVDLSASSRPLRIGFQERCPEHFATRWRRTSVSRLKAKLKVKQRPLLNTINRLYSQIVVLAVISIIFYKYFFNQGEMKT